MIARARVRQAIGAFAAVAAMAGCAQILGADEPRELAPAKSEAGAAEPEEIEAGTAPVPEAGSTECPADQKRCDGVCVPKSIENGCGAETCTPCSLPNVDTTICESGKCTAAKCKAGFGACGDPTAGCAADLTSAATCTTCLMACNVDAGQVCTPGGCGTNCGALASCSGACVDVKTSPKHCGACGKACPAGVNGDAFCKDGACGVTCRPGFAHCDGDPVGPCAPLQIFYRDADGDGVGVASELQAACASPGLGWAKAAGDCHDGNGNVRPGQTAYFGQPYTARSGALSYDYDCSGVEQEEPASPHFPGTCGPLCEGEGYAPAGSGRSGSGVNDYCGSTRYTTCLSLEIQPRSGPPSPAQLLGPSCKLLPDTMPAIRCH